MIRRASLLTLALLSGAAPSLSGAVELPIRKAGLWELIEDIPHLTNGPIVAQHCTDETVDHLLMHHIFPTSALPCSKREMKKTGDTYIADSVCTAAGSTVTFHTEFNGDSNSAYTIKTVTKATGGVLPSETVSTTQAKWIGPCKADQRPGDIILPGGIKKNVNDPIAHWPNLPP